MNPKDFLRLGVPLGKANRRAMDFAAKFIRGGRYDPADLCVKHVTLAL
jgi:hypothetical protein